MIDINHYKKNNRIIKVRIFAIIMCFVLPISFLLGQTITNVEALQAYANKKRIEYQNNRKEAEEYAQKNNLPIREELPDGTVFEIQSIKNGQPVYNISNSLGGAKTVRTDRLWPGGITGLNLTGAGYNKLGKWDGGGVRLTHQEFNGRIFQIDSPSSLSTHATHVAGILVSSGVDANAKGMAYQATLNDYDWNYDESEMAAAAANGMEVSNHSYAQACGWFYKNWFGDVNISTTEDYKFGFYSDDARDWDIIAYNAPYYLIVKAAGNDRGEICAPDTNGDCWVEINEVWVINTEYRDPDGGANGYDCLPPQSVAKNILTVGAIEELINYGNPTDVTISSFSSWGPTDDGRIKPDIVAKGVQVYSTDSDSDFDYVNYSGTSMASPTVSGTLALLQQHYQNTHSNSIMRSATLKALALHTADEAGSTIGPDYIFGWGLFNAERAANLISLDSYGNYIIDEQVLDDGSVFTTNFYSDGTQPIKVTICWTDPAGAVIAPNLNVRYRIIKNDIDLKLTQDSSNYFPWKLDPDNSANAATNSGKNNVDNVEQVYIASPIAGTYTIDVNHEGTLTNDSQAFSLIISGNTVCEDGSIIYNTDSQKFNFCEDGVWIEK